jgi:ribosomal protein S6--L-glutamate ligase
MKKILFLVKQPQYKLEPLFMEAADKLGIKLVIKFLNELFITFDQDQHQIFLGEENLKDFDLVFFRTVGNFTEHEALISQFCAQHQIPVVDQAFQHQQTWIDRKSFEYQRLHFHNLPIIDSVLVTSKTYSKIKEKIQFPVVVKTTYGSKGAGVYKCNSSAEIEEILNQVQNPLLIQKYIENDGDIRVFIIGNHIQGAIKRKSSNQHEFRNNVSLGGTAEIYNLTETEAKLALDAAQALEFDIAGVDLIQSHDGKTFIMEVNRGPEFNGFMATTKIDIPYKILEFLQSKCK